MSGNFDVRPQVPGGSNAADLAALAALQTYAGQELSQLQSRSEKWIGGLTAITGVLTTAVVIKGTESFTSLVSPFPALVAGLMVVGGLLIGYGIYKGYVAAHGDPLASDALLTRAKEQTVDGAYRDYVTAMRTGATNARDALAAAVVTSIVGTLLLAAAVVVTWTAPAKKGQSGDSFCFRSGNQIVELSGSAPDVATGSITLIPCPE